MRPRDLGERLLEADERDEDQVAILVNAGVKAAAVHSGESSDPRAASLERLGTGELEVLFAVDMFNEGVDLSVIETVMMLRPTESQILWLQQIGRGLRLQEGKRLKVIDYIGNLRTFLLKARTLLELPPGRGRLLLQAVGRGETRSARADNSTAAPGTRCRPRERSEPGGEG
jgi:hypothetical protein